MSECSERSEYSDFQSSHRFNEIQQKFDLWKFVLICGRKKHLFNPLKSINTNFFIYFNRCKSDLNGLNRCLFFQEQRETSVRFNIRRANPVGSVRSV